MDAGEIDGPVWSVSDRGTAGGLRSSRADSGPQVLPPARVTVPPWPPAKSARVSNLLACCALGPPACAAPCSCHHEACSARSAWPKVRQQRVPIIGEGQGVYSFVHIDDAAGATAAALECPPGAYNIVDGNPSPQHLWLTAFARAAGAPAPPRVSEEEALRTSGPDAVYYATRLRGASHEKARRELAFRPRPLEWI